jgi:ectoine hydroxylase-related dioxygenase (phytanoyl-CoA dioxygenase family)
LSGGVLAGQFTQDGFCFTEAVIPQSDIDAVIPRMDAVIAGDYETGRAPHSGHKPGDPVDRLIKIDQPHLSDLTIRAFVSHPEIGRWAAAITGAKTVQVWAVQLLVKPPGSSAKGHIGFHQDMQHWTRWFTGEVFTAWIAVTDVHDDSGPMAFVRGSHQWGLNENDSFFRDTDHDAQVASIPRPKGSEWEEVAATIPRGAISFHHRLTYHGSRSNTSEKARRSFAIHLRTENSEPLDTLGGYYNENLTNPDLCPVIYSK